MSILPGVERITKLLYNVPTPWRAIHVAGTNGKGSVCAYISAMLDVYNESAYRAARRDPPLLHGRFTSPHLVHYFDGITINQKQGDRARLSHLFGQMREEQKQMGLGASEFELLTATAFAAFSQPTDAGMSLDIAVIECGMGGRDDATNIFGQSWRDGDRPAPLVTAFTKIGLDHQEFLGNNLRDIARNKAGIMRPGVPVVFDASNDAEAITILSGEAGDRCAQFNEDPAQILERYSPYGASLAENVGSTDEYKGERADTSKHTKPPGHNFAEVVRANQELPSHTLNNLNVAFKATWAALQQLSRIHQAKTQVPSELHLHTLDLGRSMLRVHDTVSFPGRLQSLSLEPLTGRTCPILLDGAHNEQSAQVLSEAVKRTQRSTGTPVAWVIAASSTKDICGILKHILLDGDKVFAVEFGPVEHMPWVKPMPSSEVLQAAKSVAAVQGFDCGRSVAEALRQASKDAEEGPMVVAGSLYLVGDVLRLLEHQSRKDSGTT